MKHKLITIVSLFLCIISPTVMGEDTPKTNDPTIEAAKKAYDAEVKKADDAVATAQKKADEIKTKAKDKLVKAYDEAIKRVTQKGDLELVNALMAEKKDIEGGTVSADSDVKASDEKALATKKGGTGLIGVIETKKGNTNLVVRFTLNLDKIFWDSAKRQMQGKFSVDPTLKLAGSFNLTKDAVIVIENPCSNIGMPKVSIDGLTCTVGDVPLKKGEHSITIDLGRHNANGDPTGIKMCYKGGKPLPFFYTLANLEDIKNAMPESNGQKAKPEFIDTK